MLRAVLFGFLLITCLFLVACGQRAQQSVPPAATTVEGIAKQFVDEMAKGDFAAATAKFDTTMKQGMPAAWAIAALRTNCTMPPPRFR